MSIESNHVRGMIFKAARRLRLQIEKERQIADARDREYRREIAELSQRLAKLEGQKTEP